MKVKGFLSAKNLILVLIFILGFYLRICHVNNGLQYIYNHDGQNFIEQALRFGKGTLKPFGFFHGPFLSYVLFFEYAFYFLINLLTGKMAYPTDLAREYILNPSLFFMLGGLAVIFFSMGVLLLTYRICSKFFDEKTGSCAVLFTGVSFYMVYLSHCIKEDMIAGFFILLSFYFALKALAEKRYFKPLCISALFVGIAISVKYYGFIGISIILSVLAIKMKNKEISLSIFLKLFLQCIFITTAVFLILSPYTIIGLKGFIKELTGMKAVYSHSYDLYNRPSWLLYLLFLKQGIGAPIFYLYLLSLFSIFSDRKILLCNAYPVFLYIFLSFFKGAMPYFLVSAIPFVLISSAFLLTRLTELLVRNKNNRPAAIFFITILFSVSTLIVSWKFCSLLKTEDTRTSAKRWVESNIRADSGILIEGSYTLNIVYSPQLRENINTLKRESDEIKKLGASGFLLDQKMKYTALQKSPTYELYKVTFISSEDIKRYNSEYLIFTSYHRPTAYPQVNLTKDYLKGRYECIKRIMPDVSITFFPSFESLYYGAFEGIDKVSFKALSALRSYGPVIEIYKKI